MSHHPPPSTSIDLGSLESAASELQFQDFSTTATLPASAQETKAPLPSRLPVDQRPLIGDDDVYDEQDPYNQKQSLGKQPPQPTSSFLELSFFAKYFDVTTQDVVSRIMYSILPFSRDVDGSSSTFIEKFIKNNPDLYGPLWINVTLIFSIAICGNIANYLSSQGRDLETWHYDFTKVGLAASTVSTYIIAVPICLWVYFWFRGCTAMFSLLETICAYGYSMSVYVPISILWVICPRVLQLVLVIIGGVTSGGTLSLAFGPVVKSDPAPTVKISYLIPLVIAGLHALLAFSFLMYFF